MATHSYFIAGTDTDVGKTHVACALLNALNKQGLSTAAYKPVSAGCEQTEQGLRNSDALLLQQHSSMKLSYQDVNPIAFAEPVAPHLAAERQGLSIDLNIVNQGYDALKAKQPDLLLVEGAGGWRLPVGQGQYLSDFVIEQKMPVILVVGIRLGCLNHALLTVEAIERDGLKVAGWIANHLASDMPYAEENKAYLSQAIKAPLLASLGWEHRAFEQPEQLVELLVLR